MKVGIVRSLGRSIMTAKGTPNTFVAEAIGNQKKANDGDSTKAYSSSYMVRLGVLGVGTIARCVLEGLCSAFAAGECPEGVESKVFISSRSQANAHALATAYPSFIEIKEDNAAIVGSCEWLIISVRPEQVEELCKGLPFREDQIILNFVSAVLSEDDAHRFLAPAKQIVRVSPYPSSKNRLGPILMLHAPGGLVETLLGLVGDVVKVDTMDQFISMQSGSCFMAPFYQALESITTWLESENIEREKASLFVGSLVHAFAHDAKQQEGRGFSEITAESQTKGGMNEQALNSLHQAGAYDALQAALTGLVQRVKANKK